MKKVTFNQTAKGRFIAWALPVSVCLSGLGALLAFEFNSDGPLRGMKHMVGQLQEEAPYAEEPDEGMCLFALPTQRTDVIFTGSDQSTAVEILEEMSLHGARPDAHVTVGSYPVYTMRACHAFADNAPNVFRTVDEARASQADNTARIVKELDELARTYRYRAMVDTEKVPSHAARHDLRP